MRKTKKLFFCMSFLFIIKISAQQKKLISCMYSMVLDTLERNFQVSNSTLYSSLNPLIIDAHTLNFNNIYSADIIKIMSFYLDENEKKSLQQSLNNRAEIVLDTSIINSRNGMVDIICRQGDSFFEYKPNSRHLRLSNPIFVNDKYCIVSFVFERGRSEYSETWLIKKINGVWKIGLPKERTIMSDMS